MLTDDPGSTRTARTARCGHTYWGAPTGAVKRWCREGCPADVPKLDLPGRPRSAPVLHVALDVDVPTSDRISRHARAMGDVPRARAVADLIRGALADGSTVGGWHRYTVPGGYVPAVREDVYLDQEGSAALETLTVAATAEGVQGARSAVLRQLLAGGAAR